MRKCGVQISVQVINECVRVHVVGGGVTRMHMLCCVQV